MLDKVLRRVWIPAIVLMILLGGPVVLFWYATRPHKIREVTNPSGTMVAQVYQHDGIVSFGSINYAVYLKPLSSSPFAAFAPQSEVVIINDAYYKEKSGPDVTWLSPRTLAVRAEAGRAYVTEGEPLTKVRPIVVRQGSKDILVTAKLLVPLHDSLP